MSANGYFIRFSLRQRIEHVTIMVLFTVLAVTGLPQKFYDAALSTAIVNGLGGIGAVRLIHRVAGVLFSLLVVFHFAGSLADIARRRGTLGSMVPNRKDFGDAVMTLRYYLGFSKEHPRFGRYDYRQKFEYWGLVAGAIIMVVTGYILYYPTLVASVLPGQLIPASKVAHSNEGLMAFLVVILWHVYNAHLNPDVFPFDTTIFTGKISRERMEKEHPLELESIEAKAAPREKTERPG